MNKALINNDKNRNVTLIKKQCDVVQNVAATACLAPVALAVPPSATTDATSAAKTTRPHPPGGPFPPKGARGGSDPIRYFGKQG